MILFNHEVIIIVWDAIVAERQKAVNQEDAKVMVDAAREVVIE